MSGSSPEILEIHRRKILSTTGVEIPPRRKISEISEGPQKVIALVAAGLLLAGAIGFAVADSVYRPMTAEQRLYTDAIGAFAERRSATRDQAQPTPTPVIVPIPNTGNLPSVK